jgi:hypothetical protein
LIVNTDYCDVGYTCVGAGPGIVLNWSMQLSVKLPLGNRIWFSFEDLPLPYAASMLLEKLMLSPTQLLAGSRDSCKSIFISHLTGYKDWIRHRLDTQFKQWDVRKSSLEFLIEKFSQSSTGAIKKTNFSCYLSVEKFLTSIS